VKARKSAAVSSLIIPPFFTHSPARGFKKENGKPHLSNEKQGYDVRPRHPSVQGNAERGN
jgi:hypothetical protein